MTTATDLLNIWRAHGVHVRRDGDDLVVHGDLPDEEVALARVLKPQLLDLLATPHVDPETLASGWRGACRELGALAGWPRLFFDPANPSRAVAPGEYNWLKWITRADVPSMELVRDALRAHLAAFPMPPVDVIPVVPTAETLPDGRPANRCLDCSQPCGTAYRCSSCAARRVHPEDR